MLARENPFAAGHLESLPYRWAGTTWEELLDRAERLSFRAALVGPHGSGKTALLGELARRLAERGFDIRRAALRRGDRRLAPQDRRRLLADPGPDALLLVDGAEQLAPWAWWHLAWRSRRAAGLLVTSHEPGLLPTLHACRSSPALLAEIVRQRLGEAEAAALAPRLEELFARHRGNLHEVLRELYLEVSRR